VSVSVLMHPRDCVCVCGLVCLSAICVYVCVCALPHKHPLCFQLIHICLLFFPAKLYSLCEGHIIQDLSKDDH